MRCVNVAVDNGQTHSWQMLLWTVSTILILCSLTMNQLSKGMTKNQLSNSCEYSRMYFCIVYFIKVYDSTYSWRYSERVVRAFNMSWKRISSGWRSEAFRQGSEGSIRCRLTSKESRKYDLTAFLNCSLTHRSFRVASAPKYWRPSFLNIARTENAWWRWEQSCERH